MTESTGIHGLPDHELLRLAKAVARPDFTEPVSRAALVLAKFGHLEGELEALMGHSKRAALAIVGAILRERTQTKTVRAGIAWAGPAPTGQGTRAPYDLLVELIATAETSVLFTGVDLQRDARLLRSLHAAQRGRELQVTVVLGASDGATHEALAAEADGLFATFKPWPALYVLNNDRIRAPLPQCLLTDRVRGVVLAGAAPEVESPDHDVTAGILLEDGTALTALYAQWQVLIDTGALLPLMIRS